MVFWPSWITRSLIRGFHRIIALTGGKGYGFELGSVRNFEFPLFKNTAEKVRPLGPNLFRLKSGRPQEITRVKISAGFKRVTPLLSGALQSLQIGGHEDIGLDHAFPYSRVSQFYSASALR